VKTVMKWVCLTIGLTALWMVTRAVVFYFVGVIAVFATAFQATVHALTKIAGDGHTAEDPARPAPELRVHRDARLAPSLVDLTAVEQQSVAN
jgi:hypothetical protein